MKNTVRILTALLLAVLLCAALIACGHDDTEHVAAGDWQSDATHHWKACEDECEGAQVDKAEHTFDNACDTSCNVCGYTRTITHAYASDWSKDATHHWYACTVCGAKDSEATHAFTVEAATTETLKAAATASAKAQYWKSCACGAISTTEYFESDKAMPTLTVTMAGKTYDGTAVANPTHQTDSAGAVTVEWYLNSTKLPAAPVNAGAYTVKVIVAETATHAGVSVTKDFAISKATPELTNVAMTPVEIVYGNSYNVNYAPLPTGAGAVTIEYKVKDAEDNTYTTTAPTNAGNYTARVTVAESDNYEGTSATVDFEIEVCVLVNLSTDVEYNGTNEHVIDLTEYGYYNVSLCVTFASKNVDALPTGVVVKENGVPSSNYIVDVSTCTVNIVAKTVGVQWTKPADLHFDGTEKEPLVGLTGVVPSDQCQVNINLKSGDNVWFDTPFTYEATDLVGTDAGNYTLPLNGNTCTSPEYTIVIDSMTVGTPSYIPGGTYYQKIVIETAGYYYFDYVASTQGAEITFAIYEKGSTFTTILPFTVGDEDEQSAAFELEAGTYYVKSVTDDQTQYDSLEIRKDEHTTPDAHGFCDKGCGTYVGEDLDTNCWESVTIPRGNTVYYRFEDGGDVSYNLSYYTDSDGTNLTVKCYRVVNAEGDFEELTGFGLLPHEFAASYDGYYYLTVKHNNALGGSTEKSITFQVEETNS